MELQGVLLGSWRKDGLGDEYSVHVKSVWLPCDCRVGTLSDCRVAAVWVR